MYEMYPEAWRADDRSIDRRIDEATDRTSHQLAAPDRPRRRARKQHSVQPPVIARAQIR